MEDILNSSTSTVPPPPEEARGRPERITATYYIETPHAPEKAAQVLAGEQSSGTFVAVPGETEELKQRFAARVEDVQLMDTVTQPSIPGAASASGVYHRA